MKYVCETCGKKFDREEEALQCEKQHEELRVAAEKAEAERQKKLDEIDSIQALLEEKRKKYKEEYGVEAHAKERNSLEMPEWFKLWSDILEAFNEETDHL